MTHIVTRSIRALTAVACLAGAPIAAFGQQATPQVEADAGAYLAARSAGVQNDYRAGATWFAKALETDPTNQGLLEGLVISEIGVGEMTRAADAAMRLSDAGGRSIAANIALVAQDAAAGNYAALVSPPEDRKIGNLLDQLVAAWAEFGNGRMSEAVERFDAISATDGLKAFGLYHKALALAAVGDFEGADEILSGRAAGPLIVNRRGIVAHLQILSQLERFDEALGLLDRSFGTEAEPETARLRAQLEAKTPMAFDVVTTAQEGLSEVFFTMAAALNGEAEDGYTLLYSRVAAYLNPKHTEAILLTAGLLEQQGQLDLAGETYAVFPPDHPAFYTAEIGRADTLYATDRKEEAVAALKALTESHPNIILVHMAYGDALRREEQFKASAEAYDRAVAMIATPTERHWGVFYSRGVAHERSGQWPKAEADFRQALALSPDQPQVLNYLGYSFVDRGENLEEALALIERAVAARPDAGYIIDSLGWAYFRLGRYDDAAAQMERASLLEPVDPVVTDHLGDVYWAVGRELEARFQWRRALSFEPEEDDAQRIRRKLEVGLDAVLEEEGAPSLNAVANGN